MPEIQVIQHWPSTRILGRCSRGRFTFGLSLLALLVATGSIAAVAGHVGQFLRGRPIEDVVQANAAGFQRGPHPARRAGRARCWPGRGEEVLQEFPDPLVESVVPDLLPHLTEQGKHEVKIVLRDERGSHGLLRHDGVQHCPSVILQRACAAGLQWPVVGGKLVAGEPHLARAQEGRAEPRRAARVHAVEHVDTQGHADHDVEGVPDAHQVARLVGRQTGSRSRALLHHAPERVLGFTTTQASDRVARKVALDHLLQGRLTQVRIQVALDNAEEVLAVRFPVRRDAAIDPSKRPVRRLLDPVHVGDRGRNDVVQSHDDVTTDGILRLDGLLRCKQHPAALFLWILELDTLLGDLCQLQERDHLEATAVGQDVAGPLHEVVQAAALV
mmetsp:Transcript_26404/g.70132  ORF Transcript_26404/g.70132 Transcript_26404/m.70132 type:complete len:386 (+) Transcript_26404:194-1351(+)